MLTATQLKWLNPEVGLFQSTDERVKEMYTTQLSITQQQDRVNLGHL